MKKTIHPKCYKILATCSCGNKMHIYSTLSKDLNLDVCNLCHPFYTGKQKIIRTGNRLDRFNKQFNITFNKDGKSTVKKGREN